jgi:hypothetical protein
LYDITDIGLHGVGTNIEQKSKARKKKAKDCKERNMGGV